MCRQQNMRGLRGAKSWSETKGEVLGKICVDIVGYGSRWRNYTVDERCVHAQVNDQRNGTGRERRDECLNSVFVLKIQSEVYLLQLKPGVPLPSPKDLLGKILIKNKKNQSTSGKRQNSLKKGRNVEPEIIEQPAPMDAEGTGTSGGKMGLV